MSHSKEMRGKQSSRNSNLLAKKKYGTRLKPYGLVNGNRYDNEEELSPEVNKKSVRFTIKQQLKNIIKNGIQED